MDEAATAACPILPLKYHRVLVPQALDILCFSTTSEMVRLLAVQKYLAKRVKTPSHAHSFAAEFVRSTKPGSSMLALGAKINAASAVSKTTKYNELTEEIQKGVCTCAREPDGTLNVRGCTKCWQKRSRKRLKIGIHEDFLPLPTPVNNRVQRNAILFKLAIPQYLADYHTTTWKLILLGSQALSNSDNAPVIYLTKIKQLEPSWVSNPSSTHYREMKLPEREEEILLPFGPNFSFYDSENGIWFEDLPSVPCISNPFKKPPQSTDNICSPSSYEIAAIEVKCPPGMSTHEFSAYQRVLSGHRQRWLVLLVELGATNMNFSSTTTMSLINYITLQAGPYQQLHKRLDVLAANWRETACMSVVITLCLRLFSALIQKIRAIISTWLTLLRVEVRLTDDGGVVYRAAEYAFWAALLCRQTFAVFLYDQGFVKLDEENARHFFRASIALSENFLVNLDQLSMDLRHLLKRDLLMSYSMRDLIKTWATTHISALRDAINETWVDIGSSAKRNYSKWKSLPSPYNSWLVSRTSATKTMAPQTVHYHWLQGHLLVDGKPLGRLPLEMRENFSVQELFGRQHLLTRPSGLAGMEYQLVNDVHGHEIHFGSRDGAVLIRALFKGSLLEHVSRNIFREPTGAVVDLPSGLVDDCVHWLNLSTGELQMRQKPQIWKEKLSNWVLDVRGRNAIRNKARSRPNLQGKAIRNKSGSILIDPHCKVGSQIAGIFQGFEDVDKLTIYRPLASSRYWVELKRLEVSFFVNLHAETFHGLTNQLVLRSVRNHRKRSVLVPIGTVYWEKRDIHTSVKVKNEATYARFDINQPLLLYLKALLHAMTSFPIPDGLTGRTGSEEARHCLIATSSQPWTPLQSPPQRILSILERLGPRRYYYPPGSKIYQNVIWDNNLTMNVQHEILGTLLETLQISTDTETEPPFEDVRATPHLRMRGIIRRQLYERVSNNDESKVLSLAAQDIAYRPRDRDSTSKGSCQVYRTIKALQDRNDGVPKLVKLEHLLRKCDVIGGFQPPSTMLDVQMILYSEIVPLWGSFVQACRSHGLSNSYTTHFMMALLAFGDDLGYATTAPQQSLFIDFTVFEEPRTLQLRKLIIAKQMPYHHSLLISGKRKDTTRSRLKRLCMNHMFSWPAIPSSLEEFEGLTDRLILRFFDITKAWMGLEAEMHRLLRNQELSAYLLQLDLKVEQLYESQDVMTSEAQNRIWKSTPRALAPTKANAMKHPYQVPPARAPPPEIAMLRGIIQPFLHKGSARDQYIMDLADSLDALMKDRVIPPSLEKAARANDVSQEIAAARDELDEVMETISLSLLQGEPDFAWLHASNLWPCISQVALLEQLRSHMPMSLGKGMKEALVCCGIAITHLQRLLRIEDARLCGDDRRHDEEQSYEGHTNWEPIDNAEWLLLEVDNDILIRESQVDVARAIISPPSGVNSVLQMNMGQGKMSCIMPMAVSVLADRKSLCRLIVPKALLFQTAQIIQSRLGGLVGRIIRHIPFTRRSPANTETLERYQALHRSTLESGGVMLCLPEHILSFKLSDLQHLADNQSQTAQKMVQIQQWLDKLCRDILDKSDFTLSVKTQLIYPSGPQTAVDGHPHRWLVVEELLSLVEGHAERLEKEFPDGVEVVRRHGGYPIIYFLRPEPEDSLNELLVNDVCERIILLCLKKRWNVQYGLHPERSPIAVPFEAKGFPLQTAEYGHPDTAILLTCLSFYQTGLTKAQIYRSLKQVVEADDSAAQFDRWISSCNTLPQNLQHWNLINPDDDAQVAQLWKHLIKLQASGWDIPLMSNEASLRNAEHAQNLTTGFSGMNDNKRMLPETIKQDHLPSLVQTNVEVLCYLMQDRNMRCIQAADWNGHYLIEEEILRLLHREKIRILIDAGAHILEMNNYDVAGAWLDIDTDAKGAMYFGKNNDILNLEFCVIYIDEGHTRGTDLKLPVYARGAVTLSLGQTKDQTVQAAMRLRQLGSTQSVTFVAPPEHTRGDLFFKRAHIVTLVDVVRWLLEQSCKFNEQMMPLHIAQGLNFYHRTNKLLGVIRLQEHQTLEQLYCTRLSASQTDKINFDFAQLQTFSSVLDKKRYTSSSQALTPAAAFMEVEQEREVEFEVEQVREKQSDMQYTPRKFPGLAGFIKSFVATGKLEAGGPYLQAFEFIGQEDGLKAFVSREFANTTRPVEWVLWSPSTETALIIISEELESIMPMLRDQKKPRVWLLCYAAPVTRSMQNFNSLVYYTIPSWTNGRLFPEFLTIEIGIVAGRLYFDYSEYKYLLSWLGIISNEGGDGMSNGTAFMSCGFPVKNSLNFLQEWLTYRRQTLDIVETEDIIGYPPVG
ncbi:hypothetical protein GGI43DRAFT_433343 [Trichoderma evansii]